ncbi:hypothetical protein LZ31DRAFT_420568, partial [Colletotrichum somersetense]
FLTQKSRISPVMDYQGMEIRRDDRSITIREIAAYQKAINDEPGVKPWWSGENTGLNGYYFSGKGRDFFQG